MAMRSTAATIARYTDQLEDALGGTPELHGALQNPELLQELMRKPGSRLVGAGSRLLTGRALQVAWYGLIPSYGLTLLYINFHFFANHFAHRKAFTPLGSEWKIWRMVLGWPSFGLKYAEVIALFLLDAIVAVAILTAIVLITLIAWAAAHPCEFTTAVGPAVAAAFGPTGLGVWLGCRTL